MKRPAKPSAQIKKAAPATPSSPVPIYVLSDSTGNLAFHMLSTFITQFPPDAFSLHRHNFLRAPADLSAALDRAVADKGMIFHAFVSAEFKDLVAQRCAAAGLPCCDLTGQFVEFLSHHSGLAPSPNIQRLHDVGDEYHFRIKAIEFTLEHDDGLGLPTLHEADAVLVGVSRTSKTPTSVYLAQQGYRIANVALAQGVNPPKELLGLPKTKVVGLLIDPLHLAGIRTNRQASWHMADTGYNDPDAVRDEVIWSRRLFVSNGWKTLDVTNQAIEETAARIVNLLNLSQPGSS